METIKQAIGIDVSKETLSVCYGSIDTAQQITYRAHKNFPNTPSGFQALLEWATHLHREDCPVWWIMEATGVYYEQLAFFLAEQQQQLCVMLPTAVKHFAKSTPIKTKTDRIDAMVLCRLALERALTPWQVASPLMRQLKSLTREYQRLLTERTAAANQRHALQHSYAPLAKQIERLEEQIVMFNQQIAAVEAEIAELIDQDPELRQRIDKVTTIKGVGLMTVVRILSETNGFALVRSAKQLTSYAGLDIVEAQSGTIRGATHISKKGNARIRAALYMPALSAMRSDPQMAACSARVAERHGGHKKPGIVAIQRKLLRMIYALWKSGQEYNPQLA